MAPPFTNNSVTESSTAKLSTESLGDVKGSSHFFAFVIVIISVIIIVLLLIYIIKWIIREKRLRELRHRLIPLYTFDPNDEDDWETELLSQDQSIYTRRNSQVSKDYNSVNEERESFTNKRKLNLV